MYREKLISQIEVLEKAQTRCDEVYEFIILSRNILDIAKKIDELDEKSNDNRPPQIIPEAVSRELEKSIKEAIDRHKNNKYCFG